MHVFRVRSERGLHPILQRFFDRKELHAGVLPRAILAIGQQDAQVPRPLPPYRPPPRASRDGEHVCGVIGSSGREAAFPERDMVPMRFADIVRPRAKGRKRSVELAILLRRRVEDDETHCPVAVRIDE